MSDIVEWLRQPSGHSSLDEERAKAAAEIERLRAALGCIANSDDIENALDPARNKRVARAAFYGEKGND